MTTVKFEDLSHIDQIRWIERVQFMIDNMGLSIEAEAIETVAKRLYNTTMGFTFIE